MILALTKKIQTLETTVVGVLSTEIIPSLKCNGNSEYVLKRMYSALTLPPNLTTVFVPYKAPPTLVLPTKSHRKTLRRSPSRDKYNNWPVPNNEVLLTLAEVIEKYSEIQRGFKYQSLVWWNKQKHTLSVRQFCRNLLHHKRRRKVSESWFSRERNFTWPKKGKLGDAQNGERNLLSLAFNCCTDKVLLKPWRINPTKQQPYYHCNPTLSLALTLPTNPPSEHTSSYIPHYCKYEKNLYH